ncbi:CHRD domain-containing protein [Nonomuraea sp. NPDC050404]|uniref:CHRD domain-containing protein n=1 Tax=Nonomuraea sp. NPDC050404 TaxID=3155783 RepID=UPI003400F52A
MRRQLAAAALATAATLTAVVALPAQASAGVSDTERVRLTGKQEVPGPGDRNGSGWFVYEVRHGRLCYFVTAKRIGPATMTHIHKGRKGVAGPVVVTLKSPSKGFARGCLKAVRHQNAKTAATTLTRAELRDIVKRPHRYYVNVHNKRFPDGAIRGQLD